MTDIRQIRTTAKILPAVLSELESLGHSIASVCCAAGIKKAQGDESANLSGHDYSTLFNYACCLLAAETSDSYQPTFVTKKATDMLLHNVITCVDLAEVIERASVYCNLLGSMDISLRAAQKNLSTELSISINRPKLDTPSLLLTLASMSVFYQLFCWITATNLQLSQINLRYAKPDFPVPLGMLQAQSISYNQPRDSFVFSTAYLSLPVLRDATQLKQVIDYFPVSLVASTSDGQSLSARIQGMVQTSIGSGLAPITLEAASQLANLSTATLRRKLQHEGTSYAQIVDHCRYAEAERSLKFTDTTIKSIALQLGFSDDRAFRRAFKRWSGYTPSDIREHHLSGRSTI